MRTTGIWRKILYWVICVDWKKTTLEFWTDREIKPGELWDDVIKAKIQEADIALVLVSQAFLDSAYCQDVEIQSFLAHKKHLFPIILSPCEWKRHDWLSSRQFLPDGDKTIERHYTNSGLRKELFLTIREQLRHRVELIRQRRKHPCHRRSRRCWTSSAPQNHRPTLTCCRTHWRRFYGRRPAI